MYAVFPNFLSIHYYYVMFSCKKALIYALVKRRGVPGGAGGRDLDRFAHRRAHRCDCERHGTLLENRSTVSDAQ